MSQANPIPTVAEFMTTDPCAVDGDLTLRDARRRMSLNRIRHLLVTRDNRLAGVVSERDIAVAESLPGVNLDKTAVSVAARDQPFISPPDASVADVAEAMEARRIGCVVVATPDDVLGIFTTTDALRALRQLATGKPAERLDPPTHVLPKDAVHERPKHHVRVSEQLFVHGSGPTANMGKIGGSPI
jgi:acetoin utilization protein AcuB